MKFFNPFVKIEYNGVLLTDIASRLDYSRLNWINSPSSYYDYLYQDIDTPDNIADRYFGDSTYHWIILLTNGIVDPYFELPLKKEVFNSFLNDKYKELGKIQNISGLRYTQITKDPDYAFQKLVTVTRQSDNLIISQNYYIIDEIDYKDLQPYFKVFKRDQESYIYSVEKRPIFTIFQKEEAINENKRNIKILKKDFMSDIIKSVNDLVLGNKVVL